MFTTVPPRSEGRIAIVTDTGWDAVDVSELQRAIRAQTNNSDADGKAVWSWRSEAGAKLAMMHRIAPMTVATKRWSPGRARNKPLKPLRREGRMIRHHLWFTPRATFVARGPRVRAGTRSSLRPLVFGADEFLAKARAHRAARTWMCVLRHCEEHLRRSNPAFFLRRDGLLRGACHRARISRDPLARNDDQAL
jgi:hypothetical protein